MTTRHAAFIAFVLFAAAAVAAASAAGRGSTGPTASRCGGPLWRLKTLSDGGRKSVQLAAKPTTIGAIVERAYPRPTPTRRRTAFQRQAWEVVAQVTAFRLETGGLRLELFDDGAYLNAVIPSPSCLSRSSRGREVMTEAWKRFSADCARPTREWQAFGAVAYVRGIGFWSQKRTLRGSAPNGAELNPVTGLRIVAGCRS